MWTEIHDRGEMSKQLFTTFIALILEGQRLEAQKDRQPIALFGCVYKLL